jgi:hypothetical protein
MTNWRRSRIASRGTWALEPIPDRSGSASASAPDRSGVDPASMVERSVAAAPVLPVEHAQRFLRWLQEPGGRVGWVPAVELAQAYVEFAADQALDPIGWVAVGRELRRLLGTPKTYVWSNGKKVRVYLIPAAGPAPLTVIERSGEAREAG